MFSFSVQCNITTYCSLNLDYREMWKYIDHKRCKGAQNKCFSVCKSTFESEQNLWRQNNIWVCSPDVTLFLSLLSQFFSSCFGFWALEMTKSHFCLHPDIRVMFFQSWIYCFSVSSDWLPCDYLWQHVIYIFFAYISYRSTYYLNNSGFSIVDWSSAKFWQSKWSSYSHLVYSYWYNVFAQRLFWKCCRSELFLVVVFVWTIIPLNQT